MVAQFILVLYTLTLLMLPNRNIVDIATVNITIRIVVISVVLTIYDAMVMTLVFYSVLPFELNHALKKYICSITNALSCCDIERISSTLFPTTYHLIF